MENAIQNLWVMVQNLVNSAVLDLYGFICLVIVLFTFPAAILTIVALWPKKK